MQAVACQNQATELTRSIYLPSFELLEQGLEEGHGLLELDGGCVAGGGVLHLLRPSLEICIPFCRPPLQIPQHTTRQVNSLLDAPLHVGPSAGPFFLSQKQQQALLQTLTGSMCCYWGARVVQLQVCAHRVCVAALHYAEGTCQCCWSVYVTCEARHRP